MAFVSGKRSWREAGTVNPQGCLVVPEQDGHHVETGPNHEEQKEEILHKHDSSQQHCLMVRELPCFTELRGIYGSDPSGAACDHSAYDDPRVDWHLAGPGVNQQGQDLCVDLGLEPCPPGASRADHKGLKRAQERSSTYTNTPRHSVNAQHSFTNVLDSLQNIPDSEGGRYIRDAPEGGCCHISQS